MSLDAFEVQPTGSLISFMSLLARREGSINCAQGIPGFDPPERLLELLRDGVSSGSHQYAPGDGLPLLKQALARQYNISADSLFITNGATEAISVLYTVIKRKKGAALTVASFDPAYESYRHLPSVYDDLFVPFELTHSGIPDERMFREQMKQHRPDIFFVASPANPWGVVFSRNNMEMMASICAESGCVLIVDAVYADIWQEEPPFIPWQDISDHLVVVSSFSKMFSITGWRVGWVAVASRFRDDFRFVHDYTGLSSPSVFQEALARFLFESDEMGRYGNALRRHINRSFEIISEALDMHKFRCLPTGGGYFIWAELPESVEDDLRFCLDLFEKTGVAFVPGRHFMPSSHRFVRINIAKPEADAHEVSRRIHRYFG